MKNRQLNLTDKPLSEFTTEDTLYIQKNEGGYSVDYLCRFVGLNRGNVVADVIQSSRPYNDRMAGKRITARASKCYLWGKDVQGSGDWDRCHWFINTRERAA